MTGYFVDASASVHTLTSSAHAASVGHANHLALTYSPASVGALWVNGSLSASATVSTLAAAGASIPLTLMGYYVSTTTGSILDEVRVSGSCLYTSNFTPPTSPLTASSVTNCLYHLDSVGNVTVTVYDYECTPGLARTYSGVVECLSGGAEVTSAPITCTGTLNVNNWWFIEPLTPASSLEVWVTGAPTNQHENIAVHYPIVSSGSVLPTTISGGISGQDGTYEINTASSVSYNALLTSLATGTVKWVLSPLGTAIYRVCQRLTPRRA